jgi:hypothetical protein
MLPSIVPRLQAKVLQTEIVANNPKLHSLLAHPAGPFTSKLSPFPFFVFSIFPFHAVNFSSFLGTNDEMGNFLCQFSRYASFTGNNFFTSTMRYVEKHHCLLT